VFIYFLIHQNKFQITESYLQWEDKLVKKSNSGRIESICNNFEPVNLQKQKKEAKYSITS